MTRALMVRSIPLARNTRDSWKEAGAMFARRDSDDNRIAYLAGRGSMPIINLGSSTFSIMGDRVWNEAAVVAPLLSPAASRALLGSLMPSYEYHGPDEYWVKGAGRGGANKEKLYVSSIIGHNELKVRANWMDGDVQQNIVGQEYRVITVGHKVVQVSSRSGANGHRVYTWVGLGGAPDTVKAIARLAAHALDNERTIIGWDVISGVAGTFILEGNACPGVNTATAGRILTAIERTRE